MGINEAYGNISEDNLHHARVKYATALLLYYQTPYETPVLRPTIDLLDIALNLVPGFLDAYYLREELWHRFLKSSRDTSNQSGYYNMYLQSEAWKQKCQQVLERDDHKCVMCGRPADEVHHNTYEHIGKERLSDLASVCKTCHQDHHKKESERRLVDKSKEASHFPPTLSEIQCRPQHTREQVPLPEKEVDWNDIIPF